MSVDERGSRPAGDEDRVGEYARQKHAIAVDPEHDRILERGAEPPARFLARSPKTDYLGEQRIVERAHRLARAQPMIDAHARARRRPPGQNGAAAGQEVFVGVFRVEPRLDRVTLEANLVLGRQRLARGDPQLPGDEIEPGDRLGDRMLDLQPRVHLEKIELFGGVEQELDGSGAAVADRTRGGDRGFGDLAPQLGGDRRRRRLLDHLLVPALDRAIAFAQMDDVALRVREDLDLDMAGVRDRLLENELVRPERVARLGAGGGERRRQRAGLADEAHAAAAAAGGRLDYQRKADAAPQPQALRPTDRLRGQARRGSRPRSSTVWPALCCPLPGWPPASGR